MAAVPRGYARAGVDRFGGWFLGLPAETCSYTITPVRIPLRDGVELAGDLYLPVVSAANKTAPPHHSQLFAQGPYGRGIGTAVVEASLYAARGYQVLYVSCRGTFGSGGELDPGRTEADDGQDVVAWMRRQSWYPGSFATIGASYLGYTQWALLHDPPRDLIAAIPNVAPHDYSRNYWGTGAFRLDRILWSDRVSFQASGKVGYFAWIGNALGETRRIRPVVEGIPLLGAVTQYFGSRASWLERALVRPDIADEYYRPMKHYEALERVDVPVMLNTGWYDLFLEQTMEQYARLRERGCDVELTVGPWAHIEASGIKVMPAMFAWIEEHVAKRGDREKKSPVRIFVTGAEEWRDVDVWPPAITTERQFYLQPNQGLSEGSPPESDLYSTFIYDPLNPTPTVGGPMLLGGGRVVDDSLAARSDVLTFTTEPLISDIEVMGRPSIKLHHSSDHPNADIFVRLSTVDEKEQSQNVTECFKRLNPKETPGIIELTMTDCAHKFKKGARIRLIVAGGTFPLYARNLGSGGSSVTASLAKKTKHRIAYGQDSISVLALPIQASQ